MQKSQLLNLYIDISFIDSKRHTVSREIKSQTSNRQIRAVSQQQSKIGNDGNEWKKKKNGEGGQERERWTGEEKKIYY